MVLHVQFHLLLWLVEILHNYCYISSFFWSLVECYGNLFIHYSTIDCYRSGTRKKYQWQNRPSMSNKRCATAYTTKKMAYWTICNHLCQRNIAIRFDIHRNVKKRFVLKKQNEITFGFTSRYFIFTSFWAYKVIWTNPSKRPKSYICSSRFIMFTDSCF